MNVRNIKLMLVILAAALSACGLNAEELAATFVAETVEAASPTPTLTSTATNITTPTPSLTPLPTNTPSPTPTHSPTPRLPLLVPMDFNTIQGGD